MAVDPDNLSHGDRGGTVWDEAGGAYVIKGNTHLTPVGGFAVKLTAGEGMARGEVVYFNATGSNENVWKAPIDSDMPVGTVYSVSANAGDDVWITTTGIGYARLTDGIAAAIGNIATTSASARGYVDQAAALPAVAKHNREIGHFIETGTADQPAKILLHFN
jgi:hypothetical protein